jgi:hypothetical protein
MRAAADAPVVRQLQRGLSMRRHGGKLSCFLIAAVASGCGGAESLLPLDACRPEVALAASTGASPTFSWEPDCASGRLEVIHVRSGDLMWGVAGDQPSAGEPPAAIYSGVKYGQVPLGAYALGWTALLSAGQQYRVTLFSVDQRGAATSVGSTTFTP